MGAADTVPGVSGGTIALVLGHYTRLITAISNVDATTWNFVRRRQFAAAANRLDVRFMLALLAGILIGVGTLSGVMHHLLENHRVETMSAFFGLLVASVWIVKDNVERWNGTAIIAAVSGLVIAVGISTLPTGRSDVSLGYLFVASSVAICAMILPGVSGAFVLLLFGVYEHVTGSIKEFVRGDFSLERIATLAVFAAGCVFGLLAFSKLLKHLLSVHRDVTMAALVGLMTGSLVKLYPLRLPAPANTTNSNSANSDLANSNVANTADVAEHASPENLVAIAPWNWPNSLIVPASIAVVAMILILVVERSFNGEPDADEERLDSERPSTL